MKNILIIFKILKKFNKINEKYYKIVKLFEKIKNLLYNLINQKIFKI